MTRIQLVLALASACSFAACAGDAPPDPTTSTSAGVIRYLDTDGNGAYDAIDVTADGVADYYFASQESDLHPVDFCANPLVDTNGDGNPDGLDWNCDGVIDVPFAPSGGGGSTGGGSTTSNCSSTDYVNSEKHQITCTSSGGTSTCKCLVNDQEVSTCTTTSTSACSIPGDCCGF